MIMVSLLIFERSSTVKWSWFYIIFVAFISWGVHIIILLMHFFFGSSSSSLFFFVFFLYSCWGFMARIRTFLFFSPSRNFVYLFAQYFPSLFFFSPWFRV